MRYEVEECVTHATWHSSWESPACVPAKRVGELNQGVACKLPKARAGKFSLKGRALHVIFTEMVSLGRKPGIYGEE